MWPLAPARRHTGMKAAVLHEFKKPLALEQVPRPVPEANEVLIQVEACGVCHSDVHVADGDWPQFTGITKRPLILGHEIAGHVIEKGAAVQELGIGDRVGVPWIYWTCGECEFCRQGDENLCVKQKITGVPVEAAPFFCAGLTVYRSLKQAGISRGQRLAVFGIGGLGHFAVQIARELGAEVTAVDVSEEKLELAKSLGAVHVQNAASATATKELRAKGGFHFTLVASAARSAYDMAFLCLRPTGTLLAVGLPAENLCFPPILMAAREARIRASAVGTRQDLREVLLMASQGKIRSHASSRPLAQVNDVLEELRQGKVSGRIVLAF